TIAVVAPTLGYYCLFGFVDCVNISASICGGFVLFDFFFKAYVGHQGLHSFPTRRSSDLRVGGIGRLTEQRPAVRVEAGRCSVSRSEEHTSELQSPYDLVCRLLLEKKNDGTTVYVDFMVSSNFTANKCRDLVSLNHALKPI